MTRLLLFAALLLLLPAAQAQEWNDADPTMLAAEAAQQAYATRLANTLDRDGGARERALAVLLRRAGQPQAGASGGNAPSRPTPPDPQAEARLREALAKAGGDVLALQLLAAASADQPALRQEVARRWRDADPGNLVPLLQAGLTTEALLAQARGATRADAHMYEGMRWIMSVHRRHSPTAAEQSALAAGQAFDPDTFAALSASGLWAMTVMPGYGSPLEACGERMLRAVPARAGDCRHVADLLVDHADTVAGQVVGLAILHELATTPAEREAVARRQRPIDWRMLEWGRTVSAQDDQGIAQFVRLLADPSIESERQLADRVLQEAGIALDPPEGWTPPRR